ncbi:MAG: AI-2E family transporter, partial [Ramlibacter sp.]
MNSEDQNDSVGESESSKEGAAPVAAAPRARDPDDPSHVLLRVPVNVRSITLVVLTALAVLATLRWASAFFIPLLISVMLSYALSPLVNGMERAKIPRALSAAVLILGILGSMGMSVYAFS